MGFGPLLALMFDPMPKTQARRTWPLATRALVGTGFLRERSECEGRARVPHRMNDVQRAAYFKMKGDLAQLQSAATDMEARTERNIVTRYVAVGVNAAERYANR